MRQIAISLSLVRNIKMSSCFVDSIKSRRAGASTRAFALRLSQIEIWGPLWEETGGALRGGLLVTRYG